MNEPIPGTTPTEIGNAGIQRTIPADIFDASARSQKGEFVDDNKTFIDSAIRSGWPENRAIKCEYFPQQENAIEVAQTIASFINT